MVRLDVLGLSVLYKKVLHDSIVFFFCLVVCSTFSKNSSLGFRSLGVVHAEPILLAFHSAGRAWDSFQSLADRLCAFCMMFFCTARAVLSFFLTISHSSSYSWLPSREDAWNKGKQTNLICHVVFTSFYPRDLKPHCFRYSKWEWQDMASIFSPWGTHLWILFMFLWQLPVGHRNQNNRCLLLSFLSFCLAFFFAHPVIHDGLPHIRVFHRRQGGDHTSISNWISKIDVGMYNIINCITNYTCMDNSWMQHILPKKKKKWPVWFVYTNVSLLQISTKVQQLAGSVVSKALDEVSMWLFGLDPNFRT